MSGFHANGYSLIRKLLKITDLLETPFEGKTLVSI